MRIGTTFFEKSIPSDKKSAHIEHLAEKGFSHIEFSPHPKLIPLDELKALQLHAQHLNMSIAFHSPDFIEPSAFQVGLFGSHSLVKKSYLQLLHWIIEKADARHNFPLVIHSASPGIAGLSLHEATQVNLRFFDWIANEITREHMPIDICLENTYEKDELGSVQSHKSLQYFFQQMKGAPISLCLDLPHWWRQSHLDKKAPEILFTEPYKLIFDNIIYAHLHGMDTKFEKSHLRLNNEHSPFLDFVKAFSLKKTQINFNLEIFEVAGIEYFSSYERLLFEQLQLVNDFFS